MPNADDIEEKKVILLEIINDVYFNKLLIFH